MDYGQKDQTRDRQDIFFTAGVGNTPADQNTYEKENNLDLTNNQTPWNTDRTPDADIRNLGNRILPSSESAAESNSEGQIPNEKSKSPTPPDTFILPVSDEVIEKISFDASLIRTDGDRISKSAISEVGSVISDFTQTGDTASFYATVRGDDKHPGMVRANLKNSYNREVA